MHPELFRAFFDYIFAIWIVSESNKKLGENHCINADKRLFVGQMLYKAVMVLAVGIKQRYKG